MRRYTKMEAVMVVGIVVSLFMPSSAQEGLEGECWQRISTCTSSVTLGEFQEQCCPVITQEIINERECFCGVKPLLQNATFANIIELLPLCSITDSFDTLCPVKFQEAPCWNEIKDCIGGNVNRSESEPQFNPTSPLFNATELLCCPLMQQTARTEKQCFCSIDKFIQENPFLAQNTTGILSICSIASSADSLSGFCQGPTPSPTPAPVLSTQGSLESLKAATPPTEGSKPSGQTGAANKIVISGPLSSLIVLFIYVLFH